MPHHAARLSSLTVARQPRRRKRETPAARSHNSVRRSEAALRARRRETTGSGDLSPSGSTRVRREHASAPSSGTRSKAHDDLRRHRARRFADCCSRVALRARDLAATNRRRGRTRCCGVGRAQRAAQVFLCVSRKSFGPTTASTPRPEQVRSSSLRRCSTTRFASVCASSFTELQAQTRGWALWRDL